MNSQHLLVKLEGDKMTKCDECNKGELKQKEMDYVLLGVNLGKFPALVCTNCGEIIFEGQTMSKIEEIAKQKGLWGLAAKTRIGTSGNALDVKLPKALVKFFQLKKGRDVIVEPIDKRRFQVILT